ncbi:TonB-dependent receptor plug domain-containing protein [Terrimonas ferruginea]|uniref:TonB-dependent receptor plug domain-containing protein n=1 Tax=Terrimonas ferruginea TaxID=249 RepID=UPI0004009A8D|nr:TonB-dependent receptor [Terrimonas ferruginea]
MSKIITLWVVILFVFITDVKAQDDRRVRVTDSLTGDVIPGATFTRDSVKLVATRSGELLLKADSSHWHISATGYESRRIVVDPGGHTLNIALQPVQAEMENVVVSGTLRAVNRLESPVVVDVYTPAFFKKNPVPSVFESLQLVNGVRPQLNCSVCNTGDIHINGLEGPYTMVTIDGMPIVSSLGSVYGLFGIPTQLIERMEVVKGPASGLYGSEAIGGLINIITRSPEKAPLFSGSLMTTSWLEHNLDLGLGYRAAKNIHGLLGIHYFNYGNKEDRNNDGFTDVALQHRISLFNKLSIRRPSGRKASLATRYFYEDRWGGDMRWNKSFRGTDSIYGESIYTSRWEVIGQYQLPMNEPVMLSVSATGHRQDSRYGHVPYVADQKILFTQLTWDKNMGAHRLLTGLAYRYNYYDDNSTATRDILTGENQPERYGLPGIFLQDEWTLDEKHLLLLGARYDRHPVHKNIFTPRMAWKWSLSSHQVLRLNAGTGFRVVSLFTEDHAALTGAREVVIAEKLKPEQSYNANLNYTHIFQWQKNKLQADLSAWYTHFTNQLLPDYDTDPNQIIYRNLTGYAVSRGGSINFELSLGHRFKAMVGGNWQDVSRVERNETGKKTSIRPVLTERWSGTWTISYTFPGPGIGIDYTGNIYGPMRLPLLSPTDPRPDMSPVWSIQNIQLTKKLGGKADVFAGIKNLLNWTPAKNVPFLIARTNDPFDKQVQYDAGGQIMATPDNPYALSFDPSYVYAPNQGIRFFAGIRWSLAARP